MPTTYAVAWRDGGGRLRSGKAELATHELRLEGGGERLGVRYDELSGVSIAHAAHERIAGRPTLVLERTGAGPVRVASVAEVGIVSELAEHVLSQRLGRLAAREELAAGPARIGDVAFSWTRAAVA